MARVGYGEAGTVLVVNMSASLLARHIERNAQLSHNDICEQWVHGLSNKASVVYN